MPASAGERRRGFKALERVAACDEGEIQEIPEQEQHPAAMRRLCWAIPEVFEEARQVSLLGPVPVSGEGEVQIRDDRDSRAGKGRGGIDSHQPSRVGHRTISPTFSKPWPTPTPAIEPVRRTTKASTVPRTVKKLQAASEPVPAYTHA